MPRFAAISAGFLGRMRIREEMADAIEDAKELAVQYDRPALVLPIVAVVTADTVIAFDVEVAP